jgi:hypothetical protein
VHCAKSQNDIKKIEPVEMPIEKGNTVGDELMDELKYCVEAEK